MRVLPLEYLYRSYDRGEHSWARKAYRRCVRSPLIVRMLFGVGVLSTNGRAYFDLTSVLLNQVLKRKLRRSPTLKILEIGIGEFAIPSGTVARRTGVTLDAVDVCSRTVGSAERHVRLNRSKVNVFQSDLFSTISPERKYDLLYWNLPYNLDPRRFLPPLFEQAPDHLRRGGELIIGYNTKRLPRGRVLTILDTWADRLRPVSVDTYAWNLHEVLTIRALR